MAKETDLRARALDSISTKIVKFYMEHTFSDETEARCLLDDAVRNLDKAKELLKASDAAAAANDAATG